MKERNIQVNKLDTIAVLTISLIIKGKNGHKFFEFLLREKEAQREIKKVREREARTQRDREKDTGRKIQYETQRPPERKGRQETERHRGRQGGT